MLHYFQVDLLLYPEFIFRLWWWRSNLYYGCSVYLYMCVCMCIHILWSIWW